MRATDVAWAAGLFEGEGSISRTSVRRALQLGTTDRDVRDHFAEVMGVGKRWTQVRPGKRKPLHWWAVYAWDDCVEVLTLIRPYLGERRAERADDLLAHPPVRRGHRLGGRRAA